MFINKKNRILAELTIGDKKHQIKASYHAAIRIKQRNIDTYVIIGNILSLGKKELKRLSITKEEAIIIDKDSNTSIVVGFNNQTIDIITVIDKSNVFVKEGTKIIKI